MHRNISIILALFLSILLDPIFAEDISWQEDVAYSLSTATGNIYAVQDGMLTVYDSNTNSFLRTERVIASNTMLADSTEGLFLMQLAESTLIRLETEEPYADLDQWSLSAFSSEEYPDIYRASVIQGVLYLLTSNDTSESFRTVIAYDLKTNHISECPIPAPADMICAWDDSLLIYSTPLLGESGLYLWYPDGRAVWLQEVPGTNVDIRGGLAYSASSHTAYVQSGNILYSYDGSNLVEAAYIHDEDSYEMACAAISEKLVYMQQHTDATLKCIPVSKQQDHIIRIAGHLNDSSLISAYRKVHPDITVIYTPEDPYTEASFSERVLEGTLNADLIVTSTSTSLYQSMIRKEYILPLDSCASLTSLLDGMYPHMAEQVKWKGHYYGLPTDIVAETMGYNPKLFTEAALSVPKTIEELLTFSKDTVLPNQIVLWNDLLGSFSEALLQQIIDITFAQGLETEPNIVRKLLRAWEKYDTECHLEEESSHGESLFTRHSSVIPGRENMLNENAKPLLLAPAAGQEPVIPAAMQVILIYAKTSCPDVCLDFVAFCGDHLSESVRIALLPDCNEPVLKSCVVEEINRLSEIISDMEEQLKQDPENQTLQLKYEEDIRSLQNLQENPWEISPQAIRAYREVAPYFVFVERQWQFDSNDRQLVQLREQLQKHQISADTYVDRYEKLLRMITLENQ